MTPRAAPHRRRRASRGGTAVYSEDTLSGFADAGTALADGTEMLVGSLAFAAGVHAAGR